MTRQEVLERHHGIVYDVIGRNVGAMTHEQSLARPAAWSVVVGALA